MQNNMMEKIVNFPNCSTIGCLPCTLWKWHL